MCRTRDLRMLGQVLVTHQTGAAGRLVNKVLVAESVEIEREIYFAVLLDRATAAPLIVASTEGGVEIETVAEKSPEKIMREPIETMRSLYAALGDQFTPEAEHGMRSWLADNPQGKFGAHDYNLDEFGLDAAELRGRFGDYLDRYGVEPEGY